MSETFDTDLDIPLVDEAVSQPNSTTSTDEDTLSIPALTTESSSGTVSPTAVSPREASRSEKIKSPKRKGEKKRSNHRHKSQSAGDVESDGKSDVKRSKDGSSRRKKSSHLAPATGMRHSRTEEQLSNYCNDDESVGSSSKHHGTRSSNSSPNRRRSKRDSPSSRLKKSVSVAHLQQEGEASPSRRREKKRNSKLRSTASSSTSSRGKVRPLDEVPGAGCVTDIDDADFSPRLSMDQGRHGACYEEGRAAPRMHHHMHGSKGLTVPRSASFIGGSDFMMSGEADCDDPVRDEKERARQVHISKAMERWSNNSSPTPVPAKKPPKGGDKPDEREDKIGAALQSWMGGPMPSDSVRSGSRSKSRMFASEKTKKGSLPRPKDKDKEVDPEPPAWSLPEPTPLSDTGNEAIRLFNEGKMKKAIQILVDAREIKSNGPRDIANFLWEYGSKLDKKLRGEYMGSLPNKKVLREFIAQINFRSLDFDMGMRRLVLCVTPPGEAQQIDRVVTAFAHEYCRQNPNTDPLGHPDSIMTLAFSVMMLNTDLHNPEVMFGRMTKQQFINNNIGVYPRYGEYLRRQKNNDGDKTSENGTVAHDEKALEVEVDEDGYTNYNLNDEDSLPESFLETVFDRIQDDKIQFGYSEETEVRFPGAVRRGWLDIKLASWFSKHRHWCMVDRNRMYYFKKVNSPKPLGSFPLEKFHLTIVDNKTGKPKYLLLLRDPTSTSDGLYIGVGGDASGWKSSGAEDDENALPQAKTVEKIEKLEGFVKFYCKDSAELMSWACAIHQVLKAGTEYGLSNIRLDDEQQKVLAKESPIVHEENPQEMNAAETSNGDHKKKETEAGDKQVDSDEDDDEMEIISSKVDSLAIGMEGSSIVIGGEADEGDVITPRRRDTHEAVSPH